MIVVIEKFHPSTRKTEKMDAPIAVQRKVTLLDHVISKDGIGLHVACAEGPNEVAVINQEGKGWKLDQIEWGLRPDASGAHQPEPDAHVP